MSSEIEKQIDEYKKKLDFLIESGACYEEIYEISKQIDLLINRYLDEKQQ